MLYCLKSAIGVRGCKQETEPLVYLNSLPGISVKSLDMIADEDKLTYQGVVDNVIQRAADRIELDFSTGLNIELEAFSDYYCVGRLQEPISFMPATMGATEQGIIFTFKQSKYLMLNVLNILFRAESDKTVTFFVKDTVTGDIYDTFTVDLVAGENVIPINKSYAPRRHSNKLFIGYDGSTTGYYVTSDRSCYDDCEDCGCSDMCEANGGDIVSGFSVTKTGMTYGLSVQYSLDCSFSRLLCENIGALKQAMLYAAGIEYMYEMMGTSRMNRYTMTRREDFDSIKDMFEARYKNSLKAAIKNINLCDSCCFECKGGILYNYVNP